MRGGAPREGCVGEAPREGCVGEVLGEGSLPGGVWSEFAQRREEALELMRSVRAAGPSIQYIGSTTLQTLGSAELQQLANGFSSLSVPAVCSSGYLASATMCLTSSTGLLVDVRGSCDSGVDLPDVVSSTVASDNGIDDSDAMLQMAHDGLLTA